jgi:hypothetical protein
MSETSEQYRRVSEVLEQYREWLMSKPHVIGVGIGHPPSAEPDSESYCIVIMVDVLLPAAQIDQVDALPVEIDGVPVNIQEMGGFFAQ